MRQYIPVKTLLRSPLKTLLTFLLLASVTFALFSRVAEYSITSREINKAAKEYCGVGSVEITAASESYPGSPFYIYADPRILPDSHNEESKYYFNNYRYQPLSRAQIDSILELPYISSSSVRYMTAGVSDKYYRLDEGREYYNYTARYVVEGTLSEIKCNVLYAGKSNNELTLSDCTLLAGDPTYMPQSNILTFHAYSKNEGSFGSGSRIVIMYDDNYIYDTDYLKDLIIGDRYVFIGRFEPIGDPIRFFLSDHLTNPWCEAIQSIEGQPANYLENQQFSALRELTELTNSDVHTFDVVYTDDISAIMRFAEGSMAITNGRGLTKEDSMTESSVCVISADFASQNKLNLGDKITLKLGTELFEQYKGLGAVAATHERYSPPSKTVELEIVGIYMDTDGKRSQLQKPHWSYSVNTIFVPKSLLPFDERELDNQVFSPGEFSFSVGNAWDIPSFVEQVAPKFEEMGLKLIFYDDGWLDIVEQFETSKTLSTIAFLALFGAMVAAIGFIVFLFIGRKKKEYAIMRALGTSRKESAKALILPLMALTIISVLISSSAAWIYTANTVAQNDALSKIEGYVVNTSIPVTLAIGYIIGEILLVLLFALFGLRKIGAIPPLMLLQDNPRRQMRSGIIESVADTSIINDPISSVFEKRVDKINSKRVCGHALRYITRHIFRSTKKSMLSIMLPALLIGAVGQFAVMQQSYIDLCNSTVVKAKFINGLSLTAVRQILNTDYVINPYYEYKNAVMFNNFKTDLVITNDIERYTGEAAEITFAEGYDISCIKELGKACIIGKALLEENGLKPGDEVHITGTAVLSILQSLFIDKYRSEYPEEEISDEKILEIYKDEIAKEFLKEGLFYTIAGYVTTPSAKYDRIVFTPGTLKTSPIFGFEVPLDLVEFSLADNLYADEFRSYAEMVAGGSSGEYSSNRLSFIMDTSKIENILNTLKFLSKLFPLVVAAAVLIGGLLCGLIIIQTTKEAAIMRVLGMPRRRTIAVLAFEQMFLCLTGMILGAVGLLLYNGEYLKEIAIEMYLFAALYFVGCLAGTFICSVIATRRKLLELLQTKE
jgi:ABC-type antimicrobial peptide transport system permease subunit